ncbi:MAG: protein-glutamate O-methyltransferase CheR [Verrucomicrobia bacterium]|nr:MAG: protein-glutamate O-methyltransferase CheR [Verrucomicrobiota bacterium]
MKQIETLLRERIGLDAASIGASVVARLVRLRMKTCGLDRPADYARLLQNSPDEWRQLVEAVVVAETWFFRDRAAFAALVRLVREEWLPRHPVETLRILSLPCSTGEEPYSVAMTLSEAGIEPQRVQIDGADLSAVALARAARAVYGKNSFRGPDLAFRDRHFTATKEGYVLSPAIARQVRFHQINLLGDEWRVEGRGTGDSEPATRRNGETARSPIRRFADSPARPHADPRPSSLTPPYDFIFCRNLLIYFDRATQARALERLGGLLHAEGYLFVGPAELPLVREGGFVPAHLPLAFASCKPGLRRAERETARRRESETGRGRNGEPASGRSRRLADSPIRRLTNAPARPLADSAVGLAEAQALADAGQLEAAAAACEKLLERDGPSAAGYYLLGLVTEARDQEVRNEECGARNSALDTPHPALELYRKALYLEPNHQEALLHAALLLERQGEHTAAVAYRRRAKRASARSQ